MFAVPSWNNEWQATIFTLCRGALLYPWEILALLHIRVMSSSALPSYGAQSKIQANQCPSPHNACPPQLCQEGQTPISTPHDGVPRGWYVSNISIIFLCSMLVSTPFALCFVTLCGIFMQFLELTYWQDAIVPVPCFLLFLCFRKATQEIFWELDETKARSLIFPESF
jgi:hypothetical protein